MKYFFRALSIGALSHKVVDSNITILAFRSPVDLKLKINSPHFLPLLSLQHTPRLRLIQTAI